MPQLGEEIRSISFKQGSALAGLNLSISTVRVVETISQPFEIEVTLSGSLAPASIRTADLIGADAGLQIGNLHWSGIVRAFGYVSSNPDLASNTHDYRAIIVPKLWSLGLSSHNRVFNDLNTGDIVQKIFADYGLAAPKNSNLLSPSKREICVQFEETDLAFVARLLAEEGVCYRFEHSASQSQLILLRAPESGKVSLGEENISNLSFQASLHSGQVRINDYDDEKVHVEEASVKSTSPFAHKSASMTLFAGARFTSGAQSTGNHGLAANSAKDRATYRIRYLESAGNGNACQFDLDSGAAALARLELHPGTQIDGIEAVDKLSTLKTVITGFELQVSESYDGGSGAGLLRISCAQAVDHFCMEIPPKPQPRGLFSGIVTNVRASESETNVDPARRIKVKFPWCSDLESCWLRVAQGYAGKNWGASFVPRVDQEVLVEFINGDIDRPVVVGALYNGKNTGPEYTSTQSGFKTAAKKFNELRFDDKADAEEVYLEAGKDLNYLVHNNRSGTVEKDYTLAVNGQQATTVKKTRKDTTTDTHTIESDKSIELKVGGCSIKIETSGITIEAMGNTIKLESAGISIKGTTLKMNSQSTAELKANASVSVEGTGMAEVKSSGMTTIKGSMTMIN